LTEAGNKTNHAEQFSRLQDMEGKTQVQHLLVEFMIVFVACTLGWVLLGYWQLVVWYCVTYSLMLGDRWLLFRDSPAAPRKRYLLHLFLSFLTASCASFLPVFLWFHDGLLHQFVALMYLSCAMLNTFLVRTMSWPLTLCFLVPNATVILIIALSFFWSDASRVEASLALLTALFAIGYLASSLFESMHQKSEFYQTMQKLSILKQYETLGVLSSGIAHDFNNLLGIISGNLELLADETKSKKAQNLILSGLLATQRAATLTEQLLQFGGASRLKNSVIDLHTFMEEVSFPIKRLLSERIFLSIEVDDTVPNVVADRDALEAIILNIVRNSHEAIDGPGSIRIKVAGWPPERPFKGILQTDLDFANCVLVSINDTGRGIHPDDLPKVFDPYFSSKGVRQGTGLSLAMVLGFVRQTRGDMAIASEVGVGTTIDILLPIFHAAKPASPDEEPVDGNQGNDRGLLTKRNAHLLIVEDEEQLLSVLRERFEGEGYCVAAVKTGDEALAFLSKVDDLDVILTDVIMPGETQGFSLLERAAQDFVDAKFIVMSGYTPEASSVSDAVRARTVYLKKPVSLRALSKKIEEMLQFNSSI
jgi:signal transduction histidine kinase/CheY-like chemotaxis protein